MWIFKMLFKTIMRVLEILFILGLLGAFLIVLWLYVVFFLMF